MATYSVTNTITGHSFEMESDGVPTREQIANQDQSMQNMTQNMGMVSPAGNMNIDFSDMFQRPAQRTGLQFNNGGFGPDPLSAPMAGVGARFVSPGGGGGGGGGSRASSMAGGNTGANQAAWSGEGGFAADAAMGL